MPRRLPWARLLGAAGPIRLEAGGLAQRGLAIFEVAPAGEALMVEPAPVPGGPGT